MSAPQGLVSFPGLATFTRAEYVLSQGISPGVCSLELPQELLGDLQPFGDLTFSYGDQAITLFNCAVDFANIDRGLGGYIARVQILDRRWMWKFGSVSGHFNLRRPAGLPASGGLDSSGSSTSTTGDSSGAAANLRSGTERAPQDLASLCLEAMGEPSYDVSELPNDTRPEIHWSFANPANALASLCEELGCRVVLSVADNSVRIVAIGAGEPLPENAFVTFASVGLNPPELPSSLMLVGGPTVYQGFVSLRAVGLDTDGSIRPIKELGYAPPGGWGAEPPEEFPSLDELTTRTLAERSLYRWWQIVGPLPVPSQDSFSSLEGENLGSGAIKLYDRLIDTYSDPNATADLAPQRPEVWGQFEARITQQLASASVAQVYHEVTIDEARGLVITADPLYCLRDGQYRPATLWGKLAYSIRDPGTFEPLRYLRTRLLNAAVQTPPRIVRREEIFVKSVGQFDENFQLTGFSDNTFRDALDQQADFYLDAAEAEYVTQESLDVPYAGLVPIEVDGLVEQVTWSIVSGEGGSTLTRASAATEHNSYVPPYRRRRLLERQALAPSAVSREIAAATFRGPGVEG